MMYIELGVLNPSFAVGTFLIIPKIQVTNLRVIEFSIECPCCRSLQKIFPVLKIIGLSLYEDMPFYPYPLHCPEHGLSILERPFDLSLFLKIFLVNPSDTFVEVSPFAPSLGPFPDIIINERKGLFGCIVSMIVRPTPNDGVQVFDKYLLGTPYVG